MKAQPVVADHGNSQRPSIVFGGQIIANYEQVSIDDRAREFSYYMRQNLRDPITIISGSIGGRRYIPLSGSSTRSIVKDITRKYGKLQCRECSKEIVETLKNRGIKGEVIEIRGKGGNPFIISKKLGNQAISENGTHVGVKVGNTVYDNIHQDGIPYNQWIKDFDAIGGIDVKKTKF